MIYVKFNSKGEPVRASSVYPENCWGWESRWDWKSFERVAEIAAGLNKLAADFCPLEANKYLAVDSGPSVSPRYDIIEAPKVGDKISYSFNGDTYPDGEIVRISKDLRVITSSTGSRYWRVKLSEHGSGKWLKSGGTWSLVKGHVSEWNKEF